VRLKFKHTLADIIELNGSVRAARLVGWFPAGMGIALVLVGIGVIVFRNSEPDPTVVFLFGLIFIAMGLLATRIAGLGAWILIARKSPTYDIEFGDTGVTFLDKEQVFVPWESFTRWIETKNLLLLVTPLDILAIPKRGTSSLELVDLLSLLRNKLGVPSRW
jgi:hypothetical protein